MAVGMYVHSFEGNWLEHPFWRSRLMVSDEATARRIREAGLSAVVIDEGRGATASCGSCACADVRSRAPSRTHDAVAPAAAPSRLSSDEARREASALLMRTKGLVHRLYDDAGSGIAPNPAMIEPLVRDVAECVERSRDILFHFGMMKRRDEYMHLHAVSVCGYMVGFARDLGMEKDMVLRLGMAGLLHDVGKARVDGAILQKRGPLTAQELRAMRQHPETGHGMLLESGNLPEEVYQVCLQHHERIDGRGYPHGHKGTHLSKAVRMSAICDVYDALTSQRPHKDACLPGRALRELEEMKGQLDAGLVESFSRSIRLPH
ncbi:HD-GYP domain-containing protein [Sphingosinithalassobacter tenebrarum]|uniref:HD-GYP domain-containing protein n=1 Tax=Stakelama tenebrarum TaxID=2711215 RepID=A0A6G6Y7E9_9SPHN|nr:HD-GYP domain-containing protein [Sphingosinithalassobacter tenebrarum]